MAKNNQLTNQESFDKWYNETYLPVYNSASDGWKMQLDSLNKNFVYQSTWKDQFKEWMGLRSGRSDASEKFLDNLQAEFYNMVSQMREEEYNSAESMAQREQNANINPNLAGVNGNTAGTASEHTEQPITELNRDVQNVDTIIDEIPNVITTLLGCVNQVGDIQSILLSNKGKTIENIRASLGVDKDESDIFQSLQANAASFIESIMNEHDFNKEDSAKGYTIEGIKDEINNALNNGSVDFYNSVSGFSSSKRQKQFRTIVNNMFKGIKTRGDFYDKYGHYFDSKKDAVIKESSRYNPDSEVGLSNIISELANFVDDIAKLKYQYQQSALKADTRSADYENELNAQRQLQGIPTDQVTAEKNSFTKSSAEMDFHTQLQERINGLVEKLSVPKKDDKYGFLSNLAVILIYGITNGMNLPIPNISVKKNTFTKN